MKTLTVGIEGPVLAGKSTVIAEVAKRLNQRGVSCDSVACFVEAAIARGIALPDIVPRDASAQLAAVRFYLAIDQSRRPASVRGVTLLDRTCWTLLAHTASLAAMGLVDAVGPVESVVNICGLQPAELIYLDVSNARQISRAAARVDLPALLLEETFNVAFRGYFGATQGRHEAYWVDADRSVTDVVDDVEIHILSKLGIGA
jgi:thymidylate kinase